MITYKDTMEELSPDSPRASSWALHRPRRQRFLPRGVTLASWLLLALLSLTTGCLPDPQRSQLVSLFDQLVSARIALGDQPQQYAQACNAIGDVQTRLSGEPGLVDVRPAWPALRDAAAALQAVCGQTTMLSQPTTDSPTLVQARQRWQLGIQREIGLACDHLRQAAAALDRAEPC